MQPPRLIVSPTDHWRGPLPAGGDLIRDPADRWFYVVGVEDGCLLLQPHERPDGPFAGEGPWVLIDRRDPRGARIIFAYGFRLAAARDSMAR